jgi:4'-phosphopantetheinyl transferase
LLGELERSEIHVWLAFYDEIVDEGLHGAYRAILSEEERNQQHRFYFPRDRIRYLVTRALVRTVLSRYLPMLSPREWVFGTNDYGRPCIANPTLAHSSLRFNLSHTHSLIALALTHEREVGVDVENIFDRPAPVDLADRFFAPREVADLASVPIRQQQDRFFEYWTFKESYIKARGMGLSIPLERFSLRYPTDSTVELAIDAELGDDPERWQLWQFRPRPQYVLALCAERRAAGQPRLVIRKTVPLGAEQRLDPMITRVSADARIRSTSG